MIDNIQAVLRKAPLFASLTQEEMQALAARTSRRRLERGELLFSEGDSCTGLFLVASGKMRIFKLSTSGREHVLALEGPGARLPSFRYLTAGIIRLRLRLPKLRSFCSSRARIFRIFAASIPT